MKAVKVDPATNLDPAALRRVFAGSLTKPWSGKNSRVVALVRIGNSLRAQPA